MATRGKSLANTESVHRARIEAMLAEDSTMWVESAYRDRVKQTQLYAAWINGLRKFNHLPENKRRAAAMNAGYVPANPPGISKHCKQPATATDVGCLDTTEANRRRAQLAKEHGLITPIDGEPWHMENDPNWKGPQPAAFIAGPQKVENEDDEMPQPNSRVDACVAPNGGVWVLTYDGGVRANGGAPFYGSYPGLPEKDRQGARNFIAIQPEGEGYRIISDDDNGSSYAFNQTVWDEKRQGK